MGECTIMDGKGFKKQATKELSIKGKEKLLVALESFIDAKIENRVEPMISFDRDTPKRIQEAKEALKEMLMALEIRLE